MIASKALQTTSTTCQVKQDLDLVVLQAILNQDLLLVNVEDKIGHLLNLQDSVYANLDFSLKTARMTLILYQTVKPL